MIVTPEILNLPSDWQAVRASEHLTLESGQRPSQFVTDDPSDVPSWGGENITDDGFITLENQRFISREYFRTKGKGKVQVGDILVNKDGANTGKLAFVDSLPVEEVSVNEHVFIVRNKGEFDQRFLFEFLRSYLGQKQIKALIIGSAQPGLNTRFTKHVLIPKTDIDEQRRVSRLFVEIDSTITAARESIAKAERLQKGMMQQLLTGRLKPDGTPRRDSDFKTDDHFGWLPRGWQSTRIKNLISSCEYGLSRAMSEHGQYPIFRMNNIERGRLVASPLAYINLSPDDFARYRVRKGNILFNRTNTVELVGKVGIFALKGDFVFASYLVRLVATEENDPRFLNYYLNSFEGQKRIAAKVTPSIGQANINTRSLKSVWAVKPPRDEQSTIADRLDSIHELICAKEQKIGALQRLKKSLMQNLLTGRIRLPVAAAPTRRN